MCYSVIVDNVSKSFRQDQVLKNVTLKLQPGRIAGIVGRNGSGKTVLFKNICGLMQPDSGEITVEGKKLGRDIDFPESMGIIIETPGFLYTSSGFHNLKYLAGINNKITDQEIRDAMTRVGLDWKLRKWVGKYSLGMRQRLGIAQAIMEDPHILILDEPMNGLDVGGVDLVRDLLMSFKEEGKTILLASHNREDITYLCDDIYQMDQGVLTRLEI